MARKLKPCGTMAAVRRHRRANEELCELCKQAEAIDARERTIKKAGKAVRAVTKAEVDEPTKAPLNVVDELRVMYDWLGKQMMCAPPQSVASVVKQRVVLLEMLTRDSEEAGGVNGGAVDELEARRKARKSGT